MFGTKELVPMKGTALSAPSQSTAVAIVTARAVPATVKRGVLEVMLAFPLIGMARDDMPILMGIYFDACEGFEQPVVEHSLKWLRLHNPRNTPTFTQPPTPQDVMEMCQRMRKTWTNRVVCYFVQEPDQYSGKEYTWGENIPNYGTKKQVTPLPWGPAPFQPGCFIPDDMAIAAMRQWMGATYNQDKMLEMDEQRFNRLPEAAFPDGLRDQILARRKDRADAEAARKAEDDYINSLDPELRVARLDVMRGWWERTDYGRSAEIKIPGEPELIVEANALLAARKAERTERDAKWAETCRQKRHERWEAAGLNVEEEQARYDAEVAAHPPEAF